MIYKYLVIAYFMTLENSLRLKGSEPSLIRYMSSFVREDTIHLGIGQLPFDSPFALRDEGRRAFEEPLVYSSNLGIPYLRQLIAEKQSLRDGREISPELVVVTNGAQEALFSIFGAYIDNWDDVLIPEIYFGSYKKLTNFFGGWIKTFKLTKDFGIDYDDLEDKISDRIKFLVLNSPANPTGRVLSEEENEEIVSVIGGHNLYVISDEIYSELFFGEQPSTFSKFYDKTIIVNGISKMGAATGLRLGWAIAPDSEIAGSINRVHTLATSCASIVSQKAAIPVLEGKCEDEIRAYRELLEQNRDLCVESFSKMGIPFVKPGGSFYFFPDISRFGKSSLELAKEIAESETNVITVPGIAFGGSGDNHIRISYAVDSKTMKEGLERLTRFFVSESI